MKEFWKNLIGYGDYNDYYQVSNLGRVRSLDKYVSNNNGVRFIKGRILKVGHCGKYLSVQLSNNQKIKNVLIHRLVAQTFISNPNNLPCINHKDCNPENNNISNLEWCTYSYNNSYNNRIQKATQTRFKNNNYIISEQTRQKMINSHLGKVLTLETRQKQSIALKLVWKNRKINSGENNGYKRITKGNKE